MIPDLKDMFYSKYELLKKGFNVIDNYAKNVDRIKLEVNPFFKNKDDYE